MRRCFFAAAAFLLAAVFCHAQAIRDIETTVNLFRTGNAQVIQKWDVTVTEGTEWYIPIENLGKSYIHDFMVFENGKEYENDGRKWSSNRSLEEKTHRCGIVQKSGGDIELCWGQGEYGDHVYTIAYIIDNLVQSYPECDGFHWHFLNDEWRTKPQHVSITIRNETDAEPWFWEKADSCNVRYWGFGMDGNSWMEDGAIHFESTEAFGYSSFFSALVQFKKGLFQPQVKGEGTFEELKEKAMKGSDYGEEEETLLEKIIIYIIAGLFILVPLLLVGWCLFAIGRRIYRRVSGNRYKKEIFGRTKFETWTREVPFQGNPVVLYSLLQYGDYFAQDKNKAFANVVSAFFLKWIQDGLVTVEKDPQHEDRVNLRFSRKLDGTVEMSDRMETILYMSAQEAAGENQLLEPNEFKKWSCAHDTKVASWPNEAKSSGRNKWSAASKEERGKAIEFKNFLENFTLMGERAAPEVKLWKQYMIMASALGIADKVAKNFQKLFPQVMEQYVRESHMLDTATTYSVLDSLGRSSSSMVSSAVNRVAAREAARAAQERRSSGGGGSISHGGGHGGFGGGHGGGSR